MKDTFRIIFILSLMLSACEESGQRSVTDDLNAVSQPILYGTLDTNEPYVVSLFSADNYKAGPSLCNEQNTAACQETDGPNAACIYWNGTHHCVQTCPDESIAPENVCINADGYSYSVTLKCLDVEGVSFFMEDDSTIAFCNNKCSEDGTTCDDKGESIYKICDSQYVSSCRYYGYGETCVQERFDDFWCAQMCSEEGAESKKCERRDTGYVTFTRICTRVGNHLIDITQKSYACDGACNADKTDCIKPAKPSRPGGQSIGSSYCTGTLIHPEWILTAAHCITDEQFGSIVPMSYNETAQIGFGYKETGLKLYATKGPDFFFYHPEYSGTNEDYIRSDIALIRLKTPIPASVAEPVLPLPPWLAFSSADLPIMMDTSGFGYDEKGKAGTKRKISLPTTHYCGKFNPDDSEKLGCSVGEVTVKGCHPDPSYCAFFGDFDETYEETIPYGTIFAPIYEGGQCNGDSGGPTFYTVGDKRYVVGITSYGDEPCRGYNVATSVQDFYDWILQIAPEVGDQYVEVCGNGIDDDNNGLIDDDDPNCDHCGNHAVNGDEQCDDKAFAEDKMTCAQWDAKYISGNVSCNSDCTINYDACIEARCGDNLINRDEVCDGSLFKDDESACHVLFPALYSDGQVTCSKACSYDTSACIPYCGNGSIDEGEACDHGISGDVFPADSDSCEAIIGTGSLGKLACSDDCQTILSANCSTPNYCGNGILDHDELCDGTQFADNKTQCVQWNPQYVEGFVTCSDNCTIDFSTCRTTPAVGPEICGNQIDDDHNGQTDCEDPVCAQTESCQSAPPDKNIPDGSTSTKSSDSDCSAIPLTSGHRSLAWILGLMGLGVMARRRKTMSR